MDDNELVRLAKDGSVDAFESLVARYHVADAVARAQLRWYVAAALVTVVGFVSYLAGILLLEPASTLGELVVTLLFLALALPPVAIVIAIQRYRLYDIDTILSRALVYGGLTAILAGLYTASIRLFNSLFAAITGENSDLALVLTTLLLATTFTPIKGRLERVVEARRQSHPGSANALAPLLDNPSFVALIDRRIEAALDHRWPTTTSAAQVDPPLATSTTVDEPS